jgi:hypothetical protein
VTFTTWRAVGRLGESPNNWKHFGPEPQAQYSVISVLVRQQTVTWGGWTWPSGQRRCLGRGLRVGVPGTPPFWRTGGVLYGTELGSVTLKRVGLFCFPIKHSTHTLVLTRSFTRSTFSRHPPFTQYPFPSRSLVRDGPTTVVHTCLGSSYLIAHVLHCPPGPPPPAHSIIIGPAVINTQAAARRNQYHDLLDDAHHDRRCEHRRCVVETPPMHAPSRSPSSPPPPFNKTKMTSFAVLAVSSAASP